MKTLFYIVLVSCLIIQSGGAILFYSIKQTVVQLEMMEHISTENEQFSTLKMATTDFVKNKINNSELRYNGQLYDFKSAIITGDSIALLGVYDEKEEDIIHKIKVLCNDDTPLSSQKLPYKLIKLLKTVYLCPQNTLPNPIAKSTETTKQAHLPYRQTLILHTLQILSPPPEAISASKYYLKRS